MICCQVLILILFSYLSLRFFDSAGNVENAWLGLLTVSFENGVNLFCERLTSAYFIRLGCYFLHSPLIRSPKWSIFKLIIDNNLIYKYVPVWHFTFVSSFWPPIYRINHLPLQCKRENLYMERTLTKSESSWKNQNINFQYYIYYNCAYQEYLPTSMKRNKVKKKIEFWNASFSSK